MALACRTGIPPSVWLAEGDDIITTALDLMTEEQET